MGVTIDKIYLPQIPRFDGVRRAPVPQHASTARLIAAVERSRSKDFVVRAYCEVHYTIETFVDPLDVRLKKLIAMKRQKEGAKEQPQERVAVDVDQHRRPRLFHISHVARAVVDDALLR